MISLRALYAWMVCVFAPALAFAQGGVGRSRNWVWWVLVAVALLFIIPTLLRRRRMGPPRPKARQ